MDGSSKTRLLKNKDINSLCQKILPFKGKHSLIQGGLSPWKAETVPNLAQ